MKKNKIIACIVSRKFNVKLLNLLKSIDQNVLPLNTIIEKVIIFNSNVKENYKFNKFYKKKTKILIEPKKGVSNARNKCLDFLRINKFNYACFFDDDTQICKNWFIENIKFIKKFPDVKIVGGPQIFQTRKKYIKSLELNYSHGEKVRWVSTNNVFFKKEVLNNNLIFEKKLNKIFQGEDQLFFSQLNKLGYTLRWNSKSYVKEYLNLNKNNFNWFLSRNFKYGLAGGFIDIKLYGTVFGNMMNFLKLIYNFLKLLTYMPRVLFNKIYFFNCLGIVLRIFGRLIFLLGLKKKL